MDIGTFSAMIIGLSGPKGCGKTTLAKFLCAQQGFTRVSFADGLKTMLMALLEFQGVQHELAMHMMYGYLKEGPTPYLNGHSPRWAMQTLGTEWGRNQMDPDFWVSIWIRKIQTENIINVVADDVRHINECQAITDMGGKVVEIIREKFVYTKEHSSEQGVMSDYTITNFEGNRIWMLEQLLALLHFDPAPADGKQGETP